MWNFCRNSFYCCLLALIPLTVSARSNKDADAVILLKNGNPCFSYPKDKKAKKREYSFAYLSVSKKGVHGEVGWEIGIVDYERNRLSEPDSLGTCIEYGVLGPGIKLKHAAEPLQPDTPYNVFIRVTELPGSRSLYDIKYSSDFCLTKNEKGEPVIVEATGGGRGEWRCLRPNESHGFWNWLLGK